MKAPVLGGLLLAGFASEGLSFKVWDVNGVSPAGRAPGIRDIRATRIPNSKLLSMSHSAVAVAATQAYASNAGMLMSFELEDETMDCLMGPSEVLSPGLAVKFPTIKILSGSCGTSGSASVVIDTAREGSFSASLHSSSHGQHYVDNIAARDAPPAFRLYSYSDSQSMAETFANSNEFRCGVGSASTRRLSEDDEILHEVGSNLRSSRTLAQGSAHKFRLALLANKQYSSFHGNTKTSVMTELANLVSRLNGVYLRELGIFFTLIDGNDRLICLDGDQSCSTWPNDSTLINKNEGLMSSVGISTSQYDIGHSVSTGAGGVAGYPAFCTGSKARGTTGTTQPTNDPFWIDYVAHEIGHQLSGAHSFRDCNGQSDGNFMSEGAVEPGSGSSIMGYAGICGIRNVQKNSDPNFNSNNLVQMRNLIQSRVSGGCGTTFTSNGDIPTVSIPQTCTVPKGNYVQLNGQLTNSQDGQTKFAWDRVDRGYKDFTNVNVPRFRPWVPVASTKRFLPNMYYLTFGLGQQKGEIPPQAALPGDERMTFRFVARTRYITDANSPSFDLAQAGTFGYADMALTYTKAHSPLLFTGQPPTQLFAGQTVQLTWTGATSLTSAVELLIAFNTMTERFNQTDFVYETDNKDLDWLTLGVVPNNGAAALQIPIIPGNAGRKVNLMIRSVGSDQCYFFDIRPLIAYSTGTIPQPPSPPTPQPSSPPTPQPSSLPTPQPTASIPPTPGPTVPWQCPNAWFNARDGCDCECSLGRAGNTANGAPNTDPDCSIPGQPIWCNGQRAAAGVTCDFITDKCVRAGRPTDQDETPVVTDQVKPQPDEQSYNTYIIGAASAAVFGVFVASALVVKRRRSSALKRSHATMPPTLAASANPAYRPTN